MIAIGSLQGIWTIRSEPWASKRGKDRAGWRPRTTLAYWLLPPADFVLVRIGNDRQCLAYELHFLFPNHSLVVAFYLCYVLVHATQVLQPCLRELDECGAAVSVVRSAVEKAFFFQLFYHPGDRLLGHAHTPG